MLWRPDTGCQASESSERGLYNPIHHSRRRKVHSYPYAAHRTLSPKDEALAAVERRASSAEFLAPSHWRTTLSLESVSLRLGHRRLRANSVDTVAVGRGRRCARASGFAQTFAGSSRSLDLETRARSTRSRSGSCFDRWCTAACSSIAVSATRCTLNPRVFASEMYAGGELVLLLEVGQRHWTLSKSLESSLALSKPGEELGVTHPIQSN